MSSGCYAALLFLPTAFLGVFAFLWLSILLTVYGRSRVKPIYFP